MEVTHKLSCLNFSVPPGDMASNSPHVALPMTASLGFEVVSDGEGCSELASTTHLDLLPTLSDRGEGMEGVESHYRQARKRLSKRKMNRKAKKFRRINTSFIKASSVSTATPHPLGVACTSHDDMVCSDGVLKTRLLRRAKRSQKQGLDDDHLLSDTSVALDVDTPTSFYGAGRGGHQMEVTTTPTLEPYLYDDILPAESELSETTTSDR
jgi:hypothetical protein